MTIGQLIKLLNKADLEHRVYFDFANCIPDSIASWRGIYAEPALGWCPSGYSASNTDRKNCTVGELLEMLNEALRETYIGWKGGEFQYNLDSPLHVDNNGDCTHTEISNVRILRDWVILETSSSEYD